MCVPPMQTEAITETEWPALIATSCETWENHPEGTWQRREFTNMLLEPDRACWLILPYHVLAESFNMWPRHTQPPASAA